MKDHQWKRLLAFLLAFVMVVSLCPTLRAAAEEAEPTVPA